MGQHGLCAYIGLDEFEIGVWSLEDQRYRASALNLVVSAIILWNTIYIEQVVNYLRKQGWEITEQHLNHLTPLGWEHISLNGDYVWDTQLNTNLTQLRNL